MAQNDLDKLFAIQSYYCDSFNVTTQDCSFISDTLRVLVQGRHQLGWSYVKEFSDLGQRQREAERQMWTFGLSELEVAADRLQENYERGVNLPAGNVNEFLKWKEATVNLARVTEKVFSSFVTSVAAGTLGTAISLADSGDHGGVSEAERFFRPQLEILSGMGFDHVGRDGLIELLEKCKGDVEQVVQRLIN